MQSMLSLIFRSCFCLCLMALFGWGCAHTSAPQTPQMARAEAALDATYALKPPPPAKALCEQAETQLANARASLAAGEYARAEQIATDALHNAETAARMAEAAWRRQPAAHQQSFSQPTAPR